MLTGFGQSDPLLEVSTPPRSHSCSTMRSTKDNLDDIMKGERKLGEQAMNAHYSYLFWEGENSVEATGHGRQKVIGNLL